jgi:hypothetical protein
MTTRIAAVCILLFAALAGAGLILAREAGDHTEVSTEKLIEQALAGEAGKEVVAQTYLFPPGVVLPWHVSPSLLATLSTHTPVEFPGKPNPLSNTG